MALEQFDQVPAGRELARVLRELQGLKISVLAGALNDTDIALAGLGADDTIVSVLHFNIAAGNVTTVADLTAEVKAQVAGKFQLDLTDTTGDKLVVVWFDKGAL